MLGLMQDWPLLLHKVIDFCGDPSMPIAKWSRAPSKGRCTAPITAKFAIAR